MSEEPSRQAALVHAMMSVLAREPDGLHVREVIRRLREEVPPTEYELTLNNTGVERYETSARWWSLGLTKAGWIIKSDGVWKATDEGRAALTDFPGTHAFNEEVERRYAEWKKTSDEEKIEKRQAEAWALADAVVARIPEGRWSTFGDIAEATGSTHQQLGVHMWTDQPVGWHRVARKGGLLSSELYGEADRSEEQRALLVSEGLDATGALPVDRQLSRGDLAGIVADVKGGDRAWLVRASATHGASLLSQWFVENFVSLPASMLPELDPRADAAALKKAVESGYSTLGYSQREAKYEEFRAFISRMRTGDLVLTTRGDDVFVGRIAGPAVQVLSENKRSNLRRTTEWEDLDSPLLVEDLSARLKDRLGASAEIVELTDMLAEIEGLREQAAEIAPLASGEEGLELGEVVLPDLDETTKKTLLIDRAWLVEFVELLREKKQVILYGPPGTGKTFLAQAVAEALGGKGHVTLVQFHPSYAYEDFFEGYRPAGSADGGVSLQLVPGPFRKVVDLARTNPSEPYFLIVDEINRANLAKVFGELYFLLEYRDRSIDLLYSSGDSGPAFSLPPNVYIIGTMNTADRSIALVDSAMRRRFAFLSLHPEDEKLDAVLRKWLIDKSLPEDRADLLVELNSRIADKEFKIGPSYFMTPVVATDEGLDRIWRTSILPLLEEHHVGDSVDVKAKYGLQALRRAIASGVQAQMPVASPQA
jgi:5-methylcytosine-specific restriction protein B